MYHNRASTRLKTCSFITEKITYLRVKLDANLLVDFYGAELDSFDVKPLIQNVVRRPIPWGILQAAFDESPEEEISGSERVYFQECRYDWLWDVQGSKTILRGIWTIAYIL